MMDQLGDPTRPAGYTVARSDDGGECLVALLSLVSPRRFLGDIDTLALGSREGAYPSFLQLPAFELMARPLREKLPSWESIATDVVVGRTCALHGLFSERT